ncbi:hypothetical protein [Pararhizobium sp.]|uniref:hypothetical protein n=1 Tax=Pararhizobium sp. TaxID=1977563 RepID=UPI003D12C536
MAAFSKVVALLWAVRLMKRKPDMPGKHDFTIAYKAIGYAPGLAGDIKSVGIVILSHFNAKTGQCDPGTDRLMAKAGKPTHCYQRYKRA